MDKIIFKHKVVTVGVCIDKGTIAVVHAVSRDEVEITFLGTVVWIPINVAIFATREYHEFHPDQLNERKNESESTELLEEKV